MQYKPPFEITNKIVSLVEQIGEALGRLSVLQSRQDLRLRRINKIRTLRGSLAIEGNTLSEDQISTIMEGKQVIAPLKEVQEVRNAIKAYDAYPSWEPSSEADLLEAHGILTLGLLDSPGRYRHGAVGVMGQKEVIHVAPPASRVPILMSDLLDWLHNTETHPLIASCVFHYEFEFIHPFEDGNGRMGRLWQTLILSKWNPIFSNIPVESMIFENQASYYDSIAASTSVGQCGAFIEFMLSMIQKRIEISCGTDQVNDQVTDQVKSLLKVLKTGIFSAAELMKKLKLSHKPTFRSNYLKPALKAGYIEMTIPEKPNSRNQKYQLKT